MAAARELDSASNAAMDWTEESPMMRCFVVWVDRLNVQWRRVAAQTDQLRRERKSCDVKRQSGRQRRMRNAGEHLAAAMTALEVSLQPHVLVHVHVWRGRWRRSGAQAAAGSHDCA